MSLSSITSNDFGFSLLMVSNAVKSSILYLLLLSLMSAFVFVCVPSNHQLEAIPEAP
jgi:hypothetical protein